MASSKPICRSASRSGKRPASEVIDLPENSATSLRRRVFVKLREFRMRCVIAVVRRFNPGFAHCG